MVTKSGISEAYNYTKDYLTYAFTTVWNRDPDSNRDRHILIFLH